MTSSRLSKLSLGLCFSSLPGRHCEKNTWLVSGSGRWARAAALQWSNIFPTRWAHFSSLAAQMVLGQSTKRKQLCVSNLLEWWKGCGKDPESTKAGTKMELSTWVGKSWMVAILLHLLQKQPSKTPSSFFCIQVCPVSYEGTFVKALATWMGLWRILPGIFFFSGFPSLLKNYSCISGDNKKCLLK